MNHVSDKSLFPQAFFSLDSLVVINLADSSRGFQVRRLDFVTVGVGSKDLGTREAENETNGGSDG